MDRYTEPHFEASALITVDTQVDFLDNGPFPVAGTMAVLPGMVELLELYRKNAWPIVHIVRLYLEDGSNVDLCRRAMVEEGWRLAVPGSAGSQLANELLPKEGITLDVDLLLSGGVQEIGPNETIIYKPRFGAFYKTPLEEHLRSKNVDTVVFCGCNYPNCPRASIFDASARDFRIVLVTDAMSGLYEKGVNEMSSIGVVVMTLEEVKRIGK